MNKTASAGDSSNPKPQIGLNGPKTLIFGSFEVFPLRHSQICSLFLRSQVTTGCKGVPFAEIPAFQGQDTLGYRKSGIMQAAASEHAELLTLFPFVLEMAVCLLYRCGILQLMLFKHSPGSLKSLMAGGAHEGRHSEESFRLAE